jgi:hypothetical protein
LASAIAAGGGFGIAPMIEAHFAGTKVANQDSSDSPPEFGNGR